jgi:hypothetical protein
MSSTLINRAQRGLIRLNRDLSLASSSNANLDEFEFGMLEYSKTETSLYRSIGSTEIRKCKNLQRLHIECNLGDQSTHTLSIPRHSCCPEEHWISKPFFVQARHRVTM